MKAPWESLVDTDIMNMVEDFMQLRVKEPSLNPILDEIRHLSSPYEQTLVRRQPADSLPTQGQVLDFTWDIFQEDPTTQFKEPGEGEFTLLFRIDSVEQVLPLDNNQSLIKGSFRVISVSPVPNEDGRTFLVSLQEVI